MNTVETDLKDPLETDGEAMYHLIERLYPICRSITGEGVRSTLGILAEYVPLTVHEVPTGTEVFDWTIPPEWNIRDAYIKGPSGNKIADFKKSNLHILGYSEPVPKKKVSLKELQEHLFTDPEHPQWIPYRTSYYQRNWGFCIPHHQLEALPEGEYEVYVDSDLKDGHLTFGELYIEGDTSDEVLISCHVCHPSLCNDNLSGIALATFLAKALAERKNRYSYRFLFVPGTIGSLTWLKLNEENVARVKHGLVVVCVGDAGPFTYKRSRSSNAEIDRAVMNVLGHCGRDFKAVDFYPYGYDERQYCSPGFNLAVGSLSRTSHGSYPQYHTSADDLSLVDAGALSESLSRYLDVVSILENNKTFVNTNPKGEPQLGKHSLYQSIGGAMKADKNFQMALLWVLNLSDGQHSLLDIAERSNTPFETIRAAAEALGQCGLLAELAAEATA